MHIYIQSTVRKVYKSLSEDDDQFGWNHEYVDRHAYITVKLNSNCSLRKAFTHASNQDTFKAVITEAKVQLPNTSSATIKGA